MPCGTSRGAYAMTSAADTNVRSLGARLRHARGSISQKDFAIALGVATGTYQNYERDERLPDAALVARAVGLGWNANWLLTGEGPERLEALRRGAFRVEDEEAGYSSQPPRPNRQTLRSALEVVESGLEALDQDMTAEGKARLVELVYERLSSEAPTPAQLVGFVLNAIRETVNAGGSTGG